MPDDDNHRETGATKYPARTGPDPSDAFSQTRLATRSRRVGWD